MGRSFSSRQKNSLSLFFNDDDNDLIAQQHSTVEELHSDLKAPSSEYKTLLSVYLQLKKIFMDEVKKKGYFLNLRV